MANPEEQERLVGTTSGGEHSAHLIETEFKEEMTTFIETTKTKENVKKGQLQRVAPFLYEALVSERDVDMATASNELETIVAVVEIAHGINIKRV